MAGCSAAGENWRCAGHANGSQAIDAAGTGDIAPSAAIDLVSAIAGLAKIIETTELQKRLEALEQVLTPKKDEK